MGKVPEIILEASGRPPHALVLEHGSCGGKHSSIHTANSAI